ncbi:MAG: FAD-dependent 5-carboxymethylaminomethyl-2-thiouridine(34) oxidoreductase MnmC [Pseudomonadota bacterium]|nr:FAD-dependent 5-carboxymethylaminomethyl-2-thiouridine(34) oxidoreductase MnmC [Pseudomonadota bacterium]
MHDTVQWRDDGTPFSPRFGDIYRSAGDGAGLAQARHVFLHGCGLLPGTSGPADWAGAPRWAVLETGFGLGLNFLATWHAWRNDPARPACLFYSAIEAFPPEPQDLIRSAAPFPELAPLAADLAAQWHGLLPGVHRLRLDGERVQLTLSIGDAQPALAELSGEHDSIYLDGFDPVRNPDMWSPYTLKAVARLARRGARAATWCVAREVRDGLVAAGFTVERVPGLPPKRHALQARFAPHWDARRRTADQAPVRVDQPARCAVIGAGLAGASVACALARRGWQVTVLDRADEPATGASGLPAGVVAPHVSPDDRPLSRLTRAGVRATLDRARALLREGIDFGASGVLERHAPGERRLPDSWRDTLDSEAASASTLNADSPVTIGHAATAGVPLNDEHRALWHARAGWIRPAALVRAMLQTPGITWRGGAEVARIEPRGVQWQVIGASGEVITEADLVFITAGFDSLALLHTAAPSAPPLHALRGQVAFGPMPAHADALPPFPVNGHGSLIGHLPGDDGPWWIAGSTFERGNTRPELLAADHQANRERLAWLLPRAAEALDASWRDDRAQSWAAVRATLPDRLPAVGAWGDAHPANPGLATATTPPPLPPHLLAGLGARGLTMAVLCGEIAVAELHGDPLPVDQSLARRLLAGRWLNRMLPMAAPE